MDKLPLRSSQSKLYQVRPGQARGLRPVLRPTPKLVPVNRITNTSAGEPRLAQAQLTASYFPVFSRGGVLF